MPLDWNEGLKIGVEKVDRQHKEIFKQVNKFIEFNEEVEDEERLRDKLEELFYFLTDYVITHFKTEEEVLKEHNYPQYKEHKQGHDRFTEKINNLKYKFFNSESDVILSANEISNELLEWLIKHVKGETNEIRRHLAK